MMYGKPETHESIKNRYSGIRLLWFKVIIRAAFDVVVFKDHKVLEKRAWARGAWAWMTSSSKDFNSFLHLCSILDISPLKVRAWASSLSKDQVSKFEHVDRTISVLGTAGADRYFTGKWRNVDGDADDDDLPICQPSRSRREHRT